MTNHHKFYATLVPFWIIELAIVKNFRDAIKIVNEYAYSEPFEEFDTNRNDLYVACLFLRYDTRETSWATFLKEAGWFTDGNTARKDDGYFYKMLKIYEESIYSAEIEKIQQSEVRNIFNTEINEIQNSYSLLIPYFKKFVINKGLQ